MPSLKDFKFTVTIPLEWIGRTVASFKKRPALNEFVVGERMIIKGIWFEVFEATPDMISLRPIGRAD